MAAAVLSLPFDNAKTKMQNMKAGPDGKMPYTGILDCLRKEVHVNDTRGLFAGLPPYILRMAPHAMISLTVAQYLEIDFCDANSEYPS